MKLMLAFVLLTLVLLPTAKAIGGCSGDYTPSCLDADTLFCSKNTTFPGITLYANYTIPCQQGCVVSEFEGTTFCREPVKPLSAMNFMFFEVVAIAMLMFSMLRRKENNQGHVEYVYQHGIIAGISMVLFYALALLTTETIMVYFNWMFAIIATIWTIYLYMISIYDVGSDREWKEK